MQLYLCYNNIIVSAEYDSLSPITVPTRRLLGNHPNIPELLDGIEQDPTALTDLFTGFDGAVQDYNAMPSDGLPDGLSHLPKVKPLLDSVPTIQDMLSEPTYDICRAFLRSLRDMDPLMRRAEDRQPEPYVGFHVWEGASTHERLVGGIFQAYGMTIANAALGANAPEDERFTFRDTLLDGLIEVMVLNKIKHQDNPVLSVVESQGWFEAKNSDGTFLFTEKIRNLARS